MNPLLNHPILKYLDYNTIHAPTLEGIKKGLATKRRRLNFLIYFMVFSLVLKEVNWLIIADKSVINMSLSLVSLAAFVLFFWMIRKESEKYTLSDVQIMDEIKKHAEWSQD